MAGQALSFFEGRKTRLRACPPAPGFEPVEVPGERERTNKAINEKIGIALPLKTYALIQNLARKLKVH